MAMCRLAIQEESLYFPKPLEVIVEKLTDESPLLPLQGSVGIMVCVHSSMVALLLGVLLVKNAGTLHHIVGSTDG